MKHLAAFLIFTVGCILALPTIFISLLLAYDIVLRMYKNDN